MKFILNEYHRNISNDDLLADLINVANKLHKPTITGVEYSKNGKYHSATIGQRFGSWTNALRQAGLKTHSELNNWCASLDDFVNDVKNVAAQLGQNTLTTSEYKEYGKFNYSYPTKYHNKSWNDVLKIAELAPTPYRLGRNKEISNEELFADIERVWTKLGRQPTVTDLKKGYFKFGQNTFVRRFGGWRGALTAFVDYINNPECPNSNYNNINIDDTPLKLNDISDNQSQIQHKTTREPNLRLRFRILNRDHFKCCICGRSPSIDPSVELVIDHIYPWVKGGETTYDNLRTLCKECNIGKSDLVCNSKNNTSFNLF